MNRVLGIDPGSRVTGFGVIEVNGVVARYVASGCIRAQGPDLAGRLQVILESVSEVVSTYEPDCMAIEQVFVHRNADSALKLGQARGAAICAGVMHRLPVSEYSPRQIKQAIVGRGGASKEQIQHMICALLQLSDQPQADAADALAVALCHSNTQRGLAALPDFAGSKGRRLR